MRKKKTLTKFLESDIGFVPKVHASRIYFLLIFRAENAKQTKFGVFRLAIRNGGKIFKKRKYNKEL